MGPSGRITTLEGREMGCLWVVVPEAEGSWPCGLQLRSAQERASGSLPSPLSLGDHPPKCQERAGRSCRGPLAPAVGLLSVTEGRRETPPVTS